MGAPRRARAAQQRVHAAWRLRPPCALSRAFAHALPSLTHAARRLAAATEYAQVLRMLGACPRRAALRAERTHANQTLSQTSAREP
jgi:hypothetical protein